MNAYQFVFQLHDLFSSPLTRIAGNYNRVTGEMQRRASVVSRMFEPLGDKLRRSFTAPQGSVSDLMKKLDILKDKAKHIDVGLNRRGFIEANRQIDALEKRIVHLQGLGVQGRGGGRGGGMGGWLMRGGMVAGLAYGAYNTAEAAVGKTVVPAMQRETTRFQLNELTQNPAFVKGLERLFAAYAPEKMGELFSGSQKLLGAGVGQGEIFSTMKTLNNLSALSNAKVDELAFIQSKIKATGRVQGDEMDMLNERGISLSKQIAQVMGIREDQVRKAQEKGLITYDKFTKALELFVGKGSKYESVYERKRDSTTQGRYEFLMGQFNEKLMVAGLKALPMVNGILDRILTNGERMAPLLEPLGRLATAFNPLFEGLGGLLQQMGVLDSQFNITKGFVEKLSEAIGGVAHVIESVSRMAKWVMDDFIQNTQKKSVFQPILDKWNAPDEKEQRMLAEMKKHNKQAAFLRELSQRRAGRRADEKESSASDLSIGSRAASSGLGKAAGLEASVAGAKSSVVNINIKSFVERMELNVENVHEGIDDIERKFMEMLTRLLASGSAIPD